MAAQQGMGCDPSYASGLLSIELVWVRQGQAVSAESHPDGKTFKNHQHYVARCLFICSRFPWVIGNCISITISPRPPVKTAHMWSCAGRACLLSMPLASLLGVLAAPVLSAKRDSICLAPAMVPQTLGQGGPGPWDI